MSQLKLCAHTKHDGSPCQAIAITDSDFCYFHRSYYKAPAFPGDAKYQAPLLESHHSIQLALTDLYQSFLTGKLGFKEAQFALRLLRLASKTITEIERNAKSNGKADAQGAPFKPAVGLSGVVPGVQEGVPGPFPPLERAGSATPNRPKTDSAAIPKPPVPNPFVKSKPPQSAKSYTDVDLMPLIQKAKEVAAK